MKFKLGGCVLALVVVWPPGVAQATVSEYSGFYIPYQRAQSEQVCLNRQIMEAEYGIPLASLMEGIFSPTRTLHQNLGGQSVWRNINLLAEEGAPIRWKLNFDRYHPNGVYDYSFTLDMSAVTARHGASPEGRLKARNAAKLAAVAVVRTAELTHGAGRFRVWLRFDGLPTQDDLPGKPVYAGGVDWPGWPYTAGSSLYQAYRQDALGDGCEKIF